MKVEILSYTGKGEGKWAAADLMIFTKNTRLTQSPEAFEEIKNWPEEKKMKELQYMTRSIPSSWEFADVTFLLRDVSRAFCQQLTRTRTGSYAMGSQRVVNQSGFSYTVGPTAPIGGSLFDDIMQGISIGYAQLISRGVSVEDARGVLPINTQSNVVAKFNLRTLCDMAKSRTGIRVQCEYRDVFDLMAQAVIDIWPWAELFLFPSGEDVAKELEALIERSFNSRDIDYETRMNLHKSIDLLKKGIK